MYSLIQVIPVLDNDQLEVACRLASDDQLRFFSSTVFQSDTDSTLTQASSARTSTSCSLPEEHALTKLLHENINNSLLVYRDRLIDIHPRFNSYPVPGGMNTTSSREQIQLIQYKQGQNYEFHYDQADNYTLKEFWRAISVVLYLKPAMVGGGTVFPHQTYYPNAGEALIFPSNWCFPHSGEKVITGTKVVAVTWYYVDYVRPSK